ncbi:hypothetical protein ACQ4PT_039316 [Festuca glaucescens]
MSLLAVAVARRASALFHPAAAAASLRWMSSSSIDALRAKAASYRAMAASYRVKADALRTATHDREPLLIRVIESNMQSHDRSPVEEIPSNFPFEINKTDGFTDITLTRSLRGEQIEVLVSMPTLDQDEEDDSSSSDGYTSYLDEEDQCEKSPQEQTVPLRVTISKDDGSSLEFACTAYPDRVVIDAVSMKQLTSGVVAAVSQDDEDDQVYEFSELEENLQQELYKYLELRGITPLNAKILHEHMISMDRRRYLLWLTKLSDFVRKD